LLITPPLLRPTLYVPHASYCRQLKYPQYKGKRPPTPTSLHQQLACVLALVDAAGIPILAVPGVEADDVLGSLATRAAADGFDVVLVSPDKVCSNANVTCYMAKMQHACGMVRLSSP
jgi:DNA polymerase-1